ncbi:hypothetical protein O1M54_27235 [Streptomyces diastatochromogenes]|nr:hypothetical protein [Streptomyces diastatochromogenes]
MGPTGLMLVAAACATGLVRVERRAADPAIPVDLLRIPAYRAYAVATGAFMGMLVVGLTALPQLGSVQHVGAGEAAVMLSLLTVPSTVLPLLAARLARRLARPLVTAALFACTGTAAVLQVTGRPAALLVAAGVIGLCLGLTEGVPDGQALTYVPAHRGGAGAALFSTVRMSLETLTLAAATGVTAASAPHPDWPSPEPCASPPPWSSGRAVPARADGASVSAGSAGSRTRRGSASAGSGRSRGR